MSSNHLLLSVLGRCPANPVQFGAFSIVLAATLFAAQSVAAQPAPAPAAGSHIMKKSPRRAIPVMAVPAPVEDPPAPAPPAPERPHWPVNDAPAKPSVTWDSHGLRIEATNSSLHQILDDVSAATGAKVEGMGNDERIFGEFGPGEARDVLSQLLHGTSYNVLMIGDQGEGTPRQVVLSARRTASSSPNGNRPSPDAQEEEVVPEQPEAEEPPQQPLMNRPAMMPPQGQQGAPGVPGGGPRTPQQILQELQQRQQQLQDQQQQQVPH